MFKNNIHQNHMNIKYFFDLIIFLFQLIQNF